MDFNAVLDVVVGLVLMYLLLSLICTIINEFIASAFKLRAGNLRKGLENLIDDPNLRAAFYNAPLIKSAERISGPKGPSYLPSRTFALSILDMLKKENKVEKFDSVQDALAAINELPQSDVKDALLSLAQNSAETVDDFRDSVSTWFDDTMDRAAGIYKRRLQLISIVISLFIAIAVNADSINVTKTLWVDNALRAQIAQSAAQIVSDAQDVDELMDIEQLQADLRPLPIGWDVAGPAFATDWYKSFAGWLFKIVGLLITGLAVSLGAPFWFDLLSKITKIRGSGGVPKKGEKQ